jgi:hypothetical protein
LAALNQISDVVSWLARSRESQVCNESFPQFAAELSQLGFTQTQIDALALDCVHLDRDGNYGAASIGGHVLEMDEARLTDALNVDASTSHIFHQRLHNALKFVLQHAPDRVEPALKAGLAVYGEERLCLHLLQWFGDRFETRAARCFFELEDGFGLGMQLVKIDPNRYAAELAKRLPAHLAHQGLWSVNWVLPNLGAMAVRPFVDRLTGDEQNTIYNDAAKVVLEHIAKHGGDQAKPGLLKVLEKSESAAIRAAALGHLVEIKDPALRETLVRSAGGTICRWPAARSIVAGPFGKEQAAPRGRGGSAGGRGCTGAGSRRRLAQRQIERHSLGRSAGAGQAGDARGGRLPAELAAARGFGRGAG